MNKIIPWLRKLVHRPDIDPDSKVFNYQAYWNNRYRTGGTSGGGSYGVLADYKAGVINDLIRREQITTVIEFGCGDGNQLGLMNYSNYVGLDVAEAAVERCRRIYKADSTRRFAVYRPNAMDSAAQGHHAALVVCLDVLYHIIEEADYQATLRDIFSCADRWVVLYTNLHADNGPAAEHIHWRETLDYLHDFPAFEIVAILDHPHPELSSANFIILKRKT